MLNGWERTEQEQRECGGQLTILQKERDALLGHTSDTGSGISGYLSIKLDQLKGLDPIAAKQQRLQRLDDRLEELENSVKQCEERVTGLSSAVEPEFAHFISIWHDELEWLLQHHQTTLHQFHGDRGKEWKELLQYANK